MQPPSGEVTQLLNAWCKGEAEALERLAPVVEAELRRLARLYLSREAADNILQPTALVNEAYLRLIEWNAVEWQGRAHFFAVAAKMMRRILVNHAVARRRRKGGVPDKTADLLALDEALTALSNFDERKSQVVELRYFGGLKAEEIADILGI